MLIGVTGKARSGKDTIGEFLVRELKCQQYALADELKGRVNDMFGWDMRHGYGDLKDVVDPKWGFSPRKAYQLFGTEFGRALDTDLWVKLAYERLVPYMDRKNFVITDVRFDNEANLCRRHGILIHVKRPGIASVEAHSSEAGVEVAKGDIVLHNCGTIGQLYEDLTDKLRNRGLMLGRMIRYNTRGIDLYV